MSTENSSRSIRREIRRAEKAEAQWNRRKETGKLSVASGAGELAILVAGSIGYERIKGLWVRVDHREDYIAEAEKIAEERADQHQQVTVHPIATQKIIEAAFKNREVSDVVLIGHGNIAAVHTEKKHGFGWRDAEEASEYLKQGSVEQRFCGHFERHYSVPMGSFAVSDVTKLIAPVGHLIEDVNPDESLFEPVFLTNDNLVERIRSLNNSNPRASRSQDL